MLKNKKIFITGGSGFLGKHIIKTLYDTNEITIFSRDEAKHYYIKRTFPKVNCIVGDVRNYDLLKRAGNEYNIGIFAASLKQIDTCYYNYEEACEVIIKGAFNSRRIAIENKYESACFISSDKSRAATTLYGSMKYVAGESFISNNTTPCKLTTAIYGNVLNSTGSIIPLIWFYINNKISIPLYDIKMTRFILTITEAMNLIFKSLKYNNCNTIPNIKSFKIKDLFDIYKEKYGLLYHITEPRPNEKIHEIMASQEELRRMIYKKRDNIFLMYQNKTLNNNYFKSKEYSSSDLCITKEELYKILSDNNFFKP